MTASFWERASGPSLLQGDLLPQCSVPIFSAEFGSEGAEEVVDVAPCDLIVVTQSCDLAQAKAVLVATCPIYGLAEFEESNPGYARKGKWEEVRRGRVEGLHRLASPDRPEDNRAALVVDFRQIFSLPTGYLMRRSGELGPRWRLQSPFLEHFSQAFARFFMRVGLPSSIPPYK